MHESLHRERTMAVLTMTKPEREQFLADLHVGVMAIEHPGHPPLAIPIWYAYEPGGEVTILTSSSSVKGRLLEAAGTFSLCVQSEDPPYRYVSVEGPVTGTRPADREADTRPMAHRYLGEKAGDGYTDGAPHSADETVYSMRPVRWYTVDYSKLYR
jgi:nitroimidazol reductase NimA-like FMN-containing flavoprotein (pyridoxamine 5'-phosphate oxidase superfamily)